MKKLVISLLLIGSLAFSALSQMVIKPGIGMNFTSLSNDPASYNATGRVGWQIGGTVTFGNKFYLEPGIFWVKNNWDLQEASLTVPEFENAISSLRIPLYLGWNVVNSGDDDRNFHIFGGPSAMIVTKTNTEATGGVSVEDFNSYIMGINFGAGLSISKIFIDGGYEWGLTDLYKNEPGVQSKGFWLNAGFRLKFL